MGERWGELSERTREVLSRNHLIEPRRHTNKNQWGCDPAHRVVQPVCRGDLKSFGRVLGRC